MDKSAETNPYLELRAEKIARNEARLKQLGLLKPQVPVKSKQPSRKRPLNTVSPPTPPTRRSSRLSGKDITDNTSDYNAIEVAEEKLGKQQRPKPKKRGKKSASSASKPATIAANSVRGLSLSAPTLVEKYLGKYMEHTGKETVINEAFEQAALSEEDLQRMERTRLSFNKYCGVQLWGNGAFLWVNMGGPNNDVVNEFLEDGKLVTWFGGSRMYEESPIIERLLELGKQATINSDSGIMLWCRVYDTATKKFSPYCLLGRLGYHFHVQGSFPVAFTWKLLDHDRLMTSPERKEVFQQVMHT